MITQKLLDQNLIFMKQVKQVKTRPTWRRWLLQRL